jgi:hypothetical protein
LTHVVAVTIAKAQAILGFALAGEKEAPMQHYRRGRFENEQSNLFHPKRVRPSLEMIPLEMRMEVTKLVARMLSEYQERHAVSSDVEVQHD